MSELKTKKPTVKYILQSYGTILALALIIILFSIISPTSFFTLTNFINITRQISLLVMISLGATLVMSINEFDLSVGSMASLGGIIAAILAVKGLPIVVCFYHPDHCQLCNWLDQWLDRSKIQSAVFHYNTRHEYSSVRYYLSSVRWSYDF